MILNTNDLNHIWSLHDESDSLETRLQLRGEISRWDPTPPDGNNGGHGSHPNQMPPRWLAIVAAIMAFLIVVSLSLATASAAPDYGKVTKSWTQITHHDRTVSLATGPGSERVLSLWEARGVAMIDDPVPAVVEMAASADAADKEGRYTAYVTYTFGDGSSLSLKLKAHVYEETSIGGNLQRGTFSILAGTERFEGAAGDGTFTATQYGPAVEKATTVYRMSATFSRKSTPIGARPLDERYVNR